MADVVVLQWRGPDAFLEPEKELKELLAAWALRGTGKWDLHPFSECLAERLETVCQIITREFAAAHMTMEVVVFWCVMRRSGLPYLTLDFGVKESGGDERICYHISRRDILLSRTMPTEWVRGRIESWLAGLSQEFTKNDSALRVAIRELGCAFSRRRTLPEEVRTAAPVAGSRRAVR